MTLARNNWGGVYFPVLTLIIVAKFLQHPQV